MPFTISRLRLWFAVTGLILVSVVAGFYVRARYEVGQALKDLPAKVGVDVQQSSQGFTLSKSEGGRTLYTIHASKATQFKEGARAELRDVNIVVYGRNADRFDQIYGDEFIYDQKAGTVTGTGEVHIDLQGNAQGHTLSDQAPPQELQNPIHLRAQGVVFDQKTGMAESRGVVDFRVPQASGTARGAIYDSKKNELTMLADVVLDTSGSQPTHIAAAHGKINKEPRVLTLETVELTSGDRKLLADHAVADLAEDNSIKQVNASGNVHMNEGEGMQLSSPQALLKLGEKNALDFAYFTGGVDFASTAQGANGHSGEMLMHFEPAKAQPKKVSEGESVNAPSSELRTIYARQKVTLSQAPRPGSANPQAYALSSEAMTLNLNSGRQLQSARTEGPGELVATGAGAKNAGEQTVVDAQLFTADFSEENKLRTVHGRGAVRVTSRAPGQPDKLSTSDRMVAQFTGAGEIESVEQEGNFRYIEKQSSEKELGGRSGFAERAVYSPLDDSVTLTGAPRVVDGGLTVTADRIRLLQRSGEAFAQGNVKTTSSQLKVEPNGALLATAEPVHVTAQAMNMVQSTGMAHYSGGARLWQGSNIIEAKTIDFDQKARTLVATGDKKHPVSNVFLQVSSSGKASTILVTAPHLTYTDTEREARFSGGVVARGEDGVLTADHADVFLNAAASVHTTGPSQLDHIIAVRHVLVQQQERRAEGEKLVYTASNESYVMTGGAPMLSDPVNGTVRGDSLTFFSRDDRVVVEGKGDSRAVTHTHVSR
jgi:lipopolysaccharide export system protein LptA